ncbi:MAG: hypothetical protein KC731_35635 [Myxococcales bacterium]|nr:hypothetical protein [Myxococcales bacterium]
MTRGAHLVVGVPLALAGGCGSDTVVFPDGEGGAATGGRDAGGADMGGAGGGVELRCDVLRSAGDPITLPLDGLGDPRDLTLLRLGDDRVALTFASPVGGPTPTTLASLALDAAFSSWPPIVGAADVQFPSDEVVVTRGESSSVFGFLAVDPGSLALVLGQAEPGENGSTFVDLPIFPARIHAAARGTAGGYLAALGDVTHAEALLVAGFFVDAPTLPLGPLGCADEVLVAAVADPGGGHWLASATASSDVTCADPGPLGPRHHLHLFHATTAGLERLASLELPDPIDEIDLAPLEGGRVWLGAWQAEPNSMPRYLLRLASKAGLSGVEVPLEEEHGIGPPYPLARHALTTLGDQLVAVPLVGTDAQPGGDLDLYLIAPDGSHRYVQNLDLPPPAFPVGAPAVVADAARGVVLVSWLQQDVGLRLARLDCVE